MTVLLPAWLQTGAYTAEHDRFVATALLNPSTSLTGRGGVRLVTGTEFQVTASSPPAMTVSISAGMAFVQGGIGPVQGVYTVVNDSTYQVAVSTANLNNPRIDLVVLEVLDQAYAGTSNLAQVRVLAGTPSATPVAPTPTGSFITLAQILVPAGATTVTNSNITDIRPFATALGAPLPVRNLAERNALANKYSGLRVSLMDNAWELHTYSDSAWHGESTRFYNVTNFTYPVDVSDYAARTIVDRVKIPDPGFRYMLRLDADIEFVGARVNASVFCESSTTTSYSNKVAAGQTLDLEGAFSSNTTESANRLRINRVFTSSFTGSRWVTLRCSKDASEQSAATWTARSFEVNFQLTLTPVRPNSFVAAASTGGQL